VKLTPRLTLIFILYAAALLSVVGVLAYSNGREALRSATISELSATAIEKQAALSEWVERKQLGIALLAAEPATIDSAAALIGAPPGSAEKQGAHDKFVRQIQPRVDGGEFMTIMLIDPETGEVIAATDPSEEGKFKEDRPFFISGKLGPYVQNVYYALALQGPAMTAAAPLKGPDGRALGVLAGRINLEEMNSIINRRSGLRETDDAFLVNTSNFFVTQPYLVADPAVLKREVHTEAVNRCLAQSSGTLEADDYRGIPALVVYRWLPEQKLCLLAKMDQTEAYAPARAFGGAVAAISALALLVAAVLAVALARSLTRPILALQDGVARFGRGELDTKLPETARDELGALAHEFNKMAASLLEKDAELRAYAGTLEQKVQERTKQLQESHAQLLRAEQIGQIGSWEWNIPEDHVVWSDGLYQVFGLKPQAFGATSGAYLKQVHPQDREFVQQSVGKALLERGTFEYESRIIRPNEQIRTIFTRGELLLDQDGEPARMIAVVLDTTQRQQALQALRESEERYRSLFENMLSGYAYCQMLFEDGKPHDFIYLEINKAFAKLTGLNDVTGKRVSEVIPGVQESNPELFQIYGRVAQTGEPESFETHIPSLGIWFSISVYSPKQDYFVAVFDNITERKHAEEALRLENERFVRFVDSNIVGIAIAEADGRIALANDYYLNILGVNRQDFLDDKVDWRKFTPPEWLLADEKALRELGERGICEPYEKEYVRADGTRVPVYIADAMLPGPEEQIAAFILDISARKRAEADILRITEELRRSNAELEQFAYVASHDLQEPLRMVASYTKLLQKRYQGRLDADADEFIHYVVDGATRMQQLINSLLDYSRVGTRGRDFVSTPSEKIIQEALANLEVAIEESGAKITCDLLPTVSADATQLTQLFQNLIGNAIRFRSEKPPEIHISAAHRDDNWLFSVRDNGIGMESQYFDRIFVIFQRLHTRAEYAGTGIGLAICKKIVERHGGRIWVESELDKGSTFFFTLPVQGRVDIRMIKGN
jgi:PAS domain S-box-containing protein